MHPKPWSTKKTLSHKRLVGLKLFSPQTNANNQQHAGRRVDGQPPKVHEPHDVGDGEHDRDEDQDCACDIGQHEDHNEEDAGKSQSNTSYQFNA